MRLAFIGTGFRSALVPLILLLASLSATPSSKPTAAVHSPLTITFATATAATGLPSDNLSTIGLGWGDYDNDGSVDLGVEYGVVARRRLQR